VHQDAEAAESAAAVNASAYTVDRDIVFGEGEYAPGTSSGKRLLAHELAHTVQQRGGVSLSTPVSSATDSLERDADQVAQIVSEGRSAASLLNPYGSRSASGRSARSAIQRQDAGTPAAATTPSAEDLTARIANCIGIWETNRGQNAPASRESSLDTVAGIHASMATIEQATTPYAITALKGHKELRDKASPPLTLAELNAAEARSVAVTTLLSLVATASPAGTKPDDFISANTAAITATGLSNADVKTMFSAVTLKATLDTAHTNAEAADAAAKSEAALANKSPKEQNAKAKAAKDKSVKDAIDAMPSADRLGLGEGSLKAYINKPANWGENRAGWQRKAMAAMPNNVGTRIESVSVSESGMALAIPVIRSRVDAQLAKTPQPTTEEIVKAVGQMNNPGEANYGKHIWENYQRIYP
jgi:hypothetical protein